KDRATGRACTRCGRPACPECLHEAPVGSHCWECIKAARPPVRQRVRQHSASQPELLTRIIIGINLAVFLLTTSDDGRLRQLVLNGFDVGVRDEWYRLVTAGFVHFGIIHIAFNMVILYRFGQMLEPALGRIRFGALYLAALLGGAAGALLLTPDAYTAGASGAVFGLVGAAAVGMRRRGIDVWQSGVGPLLAINLVLTFVLSNISIGGHLGGLAGGAAVGVFMFRSDRITTRSIAAGVAVAGLVSAACMAVAASAVAV
ncbi:MAG: rhomboid family intramembrane serine protease, partial [Acidimicrobiia bacterium]